MMRFPRSRMPAGDAARAGAMAGLVGGGAMLLVRRLQEQGLLPEVDEAETGWDQLIDAEARRRRIRLSPPELRIIGVGTHLVYSALIGVIYGVVRTRAHMPEMAKSALASGLAFAAQAPARLLQPSKSRRRPARGRRRAPQMEEVAIPIGTQVVFGMATALAFKLLARGYDLE